MRIQHFDPTREARSVTQFMCGLIMSSDTKRIVHMHAQPAYDYAVRRIGLL